jgi:CRP-like cAMP-binding protein
MTLSDHLVQLSALELFRGCSAGQLRTIDKLATVLNLPAGRVLCRRGEIGRECFVILAGVAAVYNDGDYTTIGPGATVGEIALLTPDGCRTANVVAVTAVTVLTLTRSEFASMLERVPSVAH